MRKMFELQTFIQIADNVNDGLKCESIRICYLNSCKNVIEKFVTITILSKESMIFLRRQKCNFLKQNC